MKIILANCAMQSYAREGLRTLVVAKKDLTLEEYSAWSEEYYAARLVINNVLTELCAVRSISSVGRASC